MHGVLVSYSILDPLYAFSLGCYATKHGFSKIIIDPDTCSVDLLIDSAIFLPFQVTNEKVKALMDFAQLKQEYQLLREYDLFSFRILMYHIS